MEIEEHTNCAEFWAQTYRGRAMAILNRHGKWHVYLDHVLQHNMVFATAEDAIIWLSDRIDLGMPARLN